MKIKMLSKTDKEARFILEGVTPQFANALRRVAIGEIPILAIDSVDFHANDSILYDEVIAHRLGTIPLNFDTKAFKSRWECDCEGKGCSNCQIVFVIDKKGPCIVCSKDMKSADPKAASPIFDDIPIVELFEGQRLKLEATAVMGIGRQHAKWQAASAYYRYYPVAQLSGSLDNADEAVRACPKAALSIDGSKASVTEACDLCGECMRVAEPKDRLKVSGDQTRFIFGVESISGLTAEQILMKAADTLKDKAKEFGKLIGKL